MNLAGSHQRQDPGQYLGDGYRLINDHEQFHLRTLNENKMAAATAVAIIFGVILIELLGTQQGFCVPL